MARGAQHLRPEHVRYATRAPRTAALHCFVLDGSASMLARGQLALAKGVLVELLTQAYRWRDHAALLVLGGHGVALRLPPRRAMPHASMWLAPIGGGGGTPLAAALAQADALLARHTQGPRWLWLLTDARTREMPPRPTHAQHVRIIDCDLAPLGRKLGRASALAQTWGPDVPCWPLQHLARASHTSTY